MNTSNEVLKPAVGSKSFQATEEEKVQWARRFVESGISLRAFSAQNGMCYMSLWRWVNKLHQAREQGVVATDAAVPAFTEIKFLPAKEPAPWVAEWSFPNGAVLRLSKEVPAAVLAALLRVC